MVASLGCFGTVHGDEPNEHELFRGPSSANVHRTQYSLWPIRNELKRNGHLHQEACTALISIIRAYAR